VGLLLWGVAMWAAGLLRVWGAPAGSAGYLRVRVMASPLVVAITLAAALGLVVFGHHLRRARGLGD